MTKLFLLKANPEPLNDMNLPLGLIYLAGYLRERIKDIEIKILDQISDRKTIKILRKEKPELIGFSAMSTNYHASKKLAREIRKILPESYLIIGGQHITVLPDSFDKSGFDIGVIGEGEITFEKLIRCYLTFNEENFYSNLENVKGLLIQKGDEIISTGKRELIQDLSVLPLPARDLLNMKYYSLPRIYEDFKKKTDIITSRGCPFNCSYCNSPR